jgi:hypothetical protein
MHIHSGGYDTGKRYFPRLITLGVTGVRDMGAPPDDVLRLRKDIADGEVLGPRMVVCGPLLQGALPPNLARLPMLQAVNNVAEASQVVIALKSRGVDFVKVHDSLPRDTFLAIAVQASLQ